MEYIKADLTSLKQGFILQPVDCSGSVVSDSLRQIDEKWPSVIDWYRNKCERSAETALFGKKASISTETDRSLYVMFLFTQRNFERAKAAGLPATDMDKMVELAHETVEDYPDAKIYVPDHMGCDPMSGGNWQEFLDRCSDISDKLTVCVGEHQAETVRTPAHDDSRDSELDNKGNSDEHVILEGVPVEFLQKLGDGRKYNLLINTYPDENGVNISANGKCKIILDATRIKNSGKHDGTYQIDLGPAVQKYIKAYNQVNVKLKGRGFDNVKVPRPVIKQWFDQTLLDLAKERQNDKIAGKSVYINVIPNENIKKTNAGYRVQIPCSKDVSDDGFMTVDVAEGHVIPSIRIKGRGEREIRDYAKNLKFNERESLTVFITKNGQLYEASNISPASLSESYRAYQKEQKRAGVLHPGGIAASNAARTKVLAEQAANLEQKSSDYGDDQPLQ